jgi:hypothetical protein
MVFRKFIKRPIVNCIGSSTYLLAKHLAGLLGPLVGLTAMHVTWRHAIKSRALCTSRGTEGLTAVIPAYTVSCPRPNLPKQIVWRHSNEKLRLPHTCCSSPIFVVCLFLPMSLTTHHSNLNVGATEVQVHARIRPRGICGGQNGTGTGYSQSSSVFHHHSPYSYIIWGMNSRPAGGHSSETLSHPVNMNKCGLTESFMLNN